MPKAPTSLIDITPNSRTSDLLIDTRYLSGALVKQWHRSAITWWGHYMITKVWLKQQEMAAQ